MGKEEPFRSLSAPHHGPKPKVSDAELQTQLREQLSATGRKKVSPPRPAPSRMPHTRCPAPCAAQSPRRLRVRIRGDALTFLRKVVLPLFSLHLLAPAFHAVPLRLEKLQKPVAVPVAH